MKKTTANYNEKSMSELDKEIIAMRNDLVVSKLDYSVNKPKDTNSLSKKRRKLAALLNVKRSKELEVKTA